MSFINFAFERWLPFYSLLCEINHGLAVIFLYFNKKNNKRLLAVYRYLGNVLSYRAVAHQVFSAMKSLTSVFGMGTGGPFLYRHQEWYN